MSTAGKDLPARRRDEFSDWHELEAVPCDNCGCTCFYARDDPGIVWEPERAWDEGCRDRACHCHTQALLGQRRA